MKASDDSQRGLSLENQKTAAIVVNWNQPEVTIECLLSLAAIRGIPVQAVVVDNASTDDSIDRIARALKAAAISFRILERDFSNRQTYHCPEPANPDCVAVIIASDANLGYAGGNNLGMAYAAQTDTKFIWILNNDTVVASSALGFLLADYARAPRIFGTALQDYHGSNEQPSAGWIHPLMFRIGLFNRFTSAGREPRYKINYIVGASLFLPTQAYREAGGMEEGYFLYCEEGEWCLRLIKSGYSLGVCRDAIVKHKGSVSTGVASPLQEYYMCRNSLYMYERHFPLYLPWAALVILFYRVPAILLGRHSRKSGRLIAAGRGIYDYLGRRRGNTY